MAVVSRHLTAALLLLASATPVRAQRPDPMATRVVERVSGTRMRAHLEFLADDLLEGRGPGTRGDRVAAAYLVAQFRRMGLAPAGDSGGWLQRVRLVGQRVRSSALTYGAEGERLRHGDDVLLAATATEPMVSAAGELVFVGYGIVAPEHGWDDYRDGDVAGKIVIALAGRPETAWPGGANPGFPDYGSRSYKALEAGRRGAVALLLVYSSEAIGAPWADLAASWDREDLRLDAPSGSLRVSGWLHRAAGERLLQRAGSSLTDLARLASSRGFRAFPLHAQARAEVRSEVRRVETTNVLARLPGGSRADETVVIGAHYDHLGIGHPVAGDSIYNGAQDNASGTAALLALAEAFATSGVRPARTILFAAFGAEESGLLGSRAFVANPTVPKGGLVAMLNFDAMNLAGRTRDAAALGLAYSTLGTAFRRAAAAEGLRVPREVGVGMESFFARSDQLPFAQSGIPSLFIWLGTDFVGRPPEFAREQFDEYFARRYHRPDDELRPDMTTSGAVQQMRVAARLAVSLANTADSPTWNGDAELGAQGGSRP